MPDNPNMWSDGSLVLNKVSGASSAGSGMCAHVPGDAWRHRKWEHLDMVQPAHGSSVDSCRGICSVPGPLQTAQRAELREEEREGVLALQALDAIHVSVDNLSVVGTLVVLWMALRYLVPLSWRVMATSQGQRAC